MKKLNRFCKTVLTSVACTALISAMLLSHTAMTACAAGQEAAAYTMKTDKAEFKDSSGRVRGIVSFEYPVFEETSKTVKAVNQMIDTCRKEFMESDNAENIETGTKWAIQNDRFWDEYEKYFCQEFCTVTYNKNEIVSLCMLREWYGGGVHNSSVYGLNYNLNTGKKLTVSDVISGNVKKKILKALKKQMPKKDISYNPSDVVKSRKDYEFYLKEGKVYICFDSYELNQGGSGVTFTVKGKYK